MRAIGEVQNAASGKGRGPGDVVVAHACEAAGQVSPSRGGIVRTTDAEIGGRSFPAVSMGSMAIAPASRDLAEHARRHGFDLARRQQHYAWCGGGPHGGRGSHAGRGSHCARLDLRVVATQWRRRIRGCDIGPAASDRGGWPASRVGIDSLQLVFPPGGSPA